MTSGLVKNGFFSFPSKRSLFLSEIKASQLLTSLWHQCQNSDAVSVNAPTTLPVDLKPKGEIFHEVAVENAGKNGLLPLKVKQTMAYGKSLISFYKKGVVNVWNNRSEVNRLRKKEFKITNQLNSKGHEVSIRIPGFHKLTAEMCQALYMSNVENKTYSDSTRGEVVRADRTERKVDEHLFNMSRREYQLIRRTTSDFFKLPAFAIIFMIFVECTPLLCYAIPEITPSTCVLPSLVPRIWSPKYTKLLREQRLKETQQESFQDLALKNAYNLPLEDVRLTCQALRLVNTYVPVSLYPESYLRRRLQEYYQYLKVDNYFLSGLNGKQQGNIWNLTHQELLAAALERNLILDISRDVKDFDAIKDEAVKSTENEKYYNDLRLKLFHFIVDFDKYNVGYLGINHLIKDPVDYRTLMKWRKDDL